MTKGNIDVSREIKEKARELGFDEIGFAAADRLKEDHHLRQWLDGGFHGEMKYMEDHFDKRLDPRELLPGTKTVISLLYNYYPTEELTKATYKIARYAYGKDYHRIIKKRLKAFTSYLDEVFGDVQHRVFVDSAPIMERQWAARSGLGWLGKNTLLINKDKGSYFFLAEVLIDKELDYDMPVTDHCGSCRACLDACPTNAFEGPYLLNASRCISYMTIELKDEIDKKFSGKFNDWIFGCDICQEVCPWNRFSKPHVEESFIPQVALREMTDKDWEDLDEEKFDELFPGSAVRRTKFEGLKRNIDFARKG